MADQTATPLRHLGRGTLHKLREPCHAGHGAAPWIPGRESTCQPAGSNPRPSEWKASALPLSHHAPLIREATSTQRTFVVGLPTFDTLDNGFSER